MMDRYAIIVSLLLIMVVSFVSLNCHGFNNVKDYLSTSFQDRKPTFSMLQETWHLPSTASSLYNVSSEYLFKETSAVDENKKILTGRPFGGLATYYTKTFGDRVSRVKCLNKRIDAIQYQDKSCLPLLIINVYMPCDDQSQTLNPEFSDAIQSCELLVQDHVGDVMLGGDWNTDLSRSTAQTACFKNFIGRCGLRVCWEHALADRRDTYHSEINNATSCVDQFVMSENLFSNIKNCYVDTNPLNPSDHKEVVIDIDYNPTPVVEGSAIANKSNNIAWYKVENSHIDEYKTVMDELIDAIELGNDILKCDDLTCNDTRHHSAINDMCSDIIEICLNAGEQCFPATAPAKNHVPNWNSQIKFLREDALFWHSVWTDVGKPSTGALAMVMRHTRAKYHKATTQAKRNRELGRNAKLAESVDIGRGRDLWDELKKLDRNRKAVPCSINGHTNNSDIANVFANKYRDLYSSVPTDECELSEIRGEMVDEINSLPEDDNVSITVHDICTAIGKLNAQKRDGTRGTSSDHFIYCSDRMKVLITCLSNSMLSHGFTPNDLLDAVITSIPKDLKGNLCTDDNYRGIALCSSLCKIIDLVIIDKYCDKLMTSDLQFAFKKDHSTSMCTSVLKEVCSYYLAKDTDVYVCLLDASKAFDRVHFGKLFRLLEKRNIPVQIRRLLLDMYTRQKMKTVWNGSESDEFNVKNGVKQGGILSPILFCIYIDELLVRINESGLGCHIGHLSFAGLGYADDVTTSAPSLSAMQSILHICEEFALEYNVLWNCKKTVCMRIGGGGIPPEKPLTLNGNVLSWSSSVKHLGNMINHDLKDTVDINYKRGVFIGQVNKLNVKFSSVHSSLRGRLFQNFCCSWHGCQTWDLVGKSAKCMQTEWNKAVRRVLKLPYDTHRNLLPLVINSKSFSGQHRSRVGKFLDSFQTSKNKHVNFLGMRACVCTYGSLGRNYVRLLNNEAQSNPCAELLAKSQMIKELVDVRDKLSCVDGMSFDEVSDMIDYLCTY